MSTKTRGIKISYRKGRETVAKVIYARTFGEAVLKARKAGISGTIEKVGA